ncbi:MAG: enterochelin esterase-like enzyme [Marivirga sp.]|jgi:enterochelin esterase-like enzyme
MTFYHKIIYIILAAITCISCKNDDNQVHQKLVGLSVSQALTNIAEIENTEERIQFAEKLWSALIDSASIPYVNGDTAIFLYKGNAQKVNWNGDFNAWGRDASFRNSGRNIDSTSIWFLIKSFPNDARLDYKIILNNQQWIVDPQNPNQQWSGFGPNSELRMPKWIKSSHNKSKSAVPKGTIDSFTINSVHLNYTVSYQVYLPSDYASNDNLPVLYVTDGHEYIDEKLGNMTTIADNLINEQLIEPIIIVFLDPRDPNNLQVNRREQEYTLNEDYLLFVTEELNGHMDSVYRVQKENKGIIGTSLGGLNATYFGLKKPNLFINVGIQSPAYWYKPEIFNLVSNSSPTDQKVMITAGTFNDGLENAVNMQRSYKQLQMEPNFLTVNEGHSWGAWNNQLDDFLLFFYAQE